MAVAADQFRETLRGLNGSRSPEPAELAAVQQLQGEPRMLIDGAMSESESGRTFANANPANETTLGEVADATRTDLDQAIAAARRAFDETAWSTDHAFRRRCIEQLQGALFKAKDQMRATVIAELGAPVRTTFGVQIEYAIFPLGHWAQMATDYEYEQSLGESPHEPGNRRILRREPIGVVAVITPWNFPLSITLGKLGPLLAAGNAVVLKPAPQTPWYATLLGRLVAEQTDIPPGVLNVVTTSDNQVAETLATDPRVDMIHFTGSTAVGRRIMEVAAPTLKRLALELGGKSANIILDDAVFPFAVPMGAAQVAFNSGQGCVFPTRMLVPRTRYDEAIELARDAFESVPLGDPLDPDTVMGPVVSETQLDRVLRCIDTAKEEGARLITGGRRSPRHEQGYFVEPTLFADVDPNSTLAQEEVFGPVLAMIPYGDDDDAVSIANNSMYGLSGYVSSTNEERALGIASRIRTGTVSVNGGNFYSPDVPVGGYRQSGIGREYGVAGFEQLMEIKSVAVRGRPSG